jgi:hypothetical protein
MADSDLDLHVLPPFIPAPLDLRATLLISRLGQLQPVALTNPLLIAQLSPFHSTSFPPIPHVLPSTLRRALAVGGVVCVYHILFC